MVSKYVKFLIYRLPNGIKRRWWYKTNTGTNKECYVVHSRVSKLHSSRYEYLNNTILTAKHLFSNFDGIKEIIVYSLSLDTRWYETFIKLFPSTLVWMWRSVTFEDNKLSLSTKTSPYCCLINVYFTLYILHEHSVWEAQIGLHKRLSERFHLVNSDAPHSSLSMILCAQNYIRFLDKAAVKVDGDKVTGALPSNPWTLCTVTQVEEVPNSLQNFSTNFCFFFRSISESRVGLKWGVITRSSRVL